MQMLIQKEKINEIIRSKNVSRCVSPAGISGFIGVLTDVDRVDR